MLRLLAITLAFTLGSAAAAQSALVANPCPPPSPPDPVVVAMTQRLIEPGHDVAAEIDAMIKQGPGSKMAAFMQKLAERRARDWPDLCRYAADNAAITGPVGVVFIGDSITENWRTADPRLFTGAVVNRGISGQTSGQMLLRFYADVVALKPRVVHIMAGTNDIGGATGEATEQSFKNNIMAMAELARAHSIRVVLASIPPAAAISGQPSFRPAAQIVELNRWLRSYAAQNKFGFIDYHAALASPSGALRKDLGNDYVHPNANGYRIMRPLALKAVYP